MWRCFCLVQIKDSPVKMVSFVESDLNVLNLSANCGKLYTECEGLHHFNNKAGCLGPGLLVGQGMVHMYSCNV